ncbi:UbiD family decarboxylase, partial [Ferrimonas balearica]|nr:UbiD family decarboxylase [Ferrimonas balearica]
MKTTIEDMRAHGELAEVSKPVQPKHELAAVTRASQKASEKAVLFHDVAGSDMPVITNVFGSHDRLRRMIATAAEQTFCERWNDLTEEAGAARAEDCLTTFEGEDDFVSGKLSDLPAITYHARDGGP